MGGCLNSVLNVKALVGALNQEKDLVGAFSVIVQPVVEPIYRFAALILTCCCVLELVTGHNTVTR